MFAAAWSHQFARVTARFSNTLTAQFYGHTHYDEFSILRNHSTPLAVAYVAPSLTPHDGLNPAYRLYRSTGELKMSFFNKQTYQDRQLGAERHPPCGGPPDLLSGPS